MVYNERLMPYSSIDDAVMTYTLVVYRQKMCFTLIRTHQKTRLTDKGLKPGKRCDPQIENGYVYFSIMKF